MKKFILFALTFIFWSCGVDDSSKDDFHFEILPIETVSLPEFLQGNDTNRVIYTFKVPSNCHSFSDLYYLENINERTIAVVALVTDNTETGLDCENLDETIEERGFDFFAAPGFDSYIFKFWQGEDENGNDLYYTVEVPVE
jgi:hypothetical protein